MLELPNSKAKKFAESEYEFISAGDYEVFVETAEPKTFGQSTEFSMSSLLGARMVSTSETKEGGKLDDITIKQMTSGEKVNAQFKYGKPFSFRPTFSPWMSTNNKPKHRGRPRKTI